jgi:hypothetical protein
MTKNSGNYTIGTKIKVWAAVVDSR